MTTLRYFIFGLLLLFVGCEDASDEISFGKLQGWVMDNKTNEPIAQAVISTNPASQSIMTDSEGRFELSGLEAGEYVVTAKRYGYSNGIEKINIRGDKTSQLIIQLVLSESGESSVDLSSPLPAHNNEEVDISSVFRWKSSAKEGDDVAYQLLVYTANSATPVVDVEQIADTFYTVNNLDYSSAHLWQVVAKKNDRQVGQSPVWSFKTSAMPVYPFLFIKGGNDKNIYSAKQKGDEHPKQMTASSFQNLFPRRNPVTREILFSAIENGFSYLYLMNKDGSDVKQIPNTKVAGYHNAGTGFCWSPTGEEILFCQYDKLYKINKDGSGQDRISTAPAGRNYVFVDWSNAANKIVAQTRGVNIYDSEIYLMDTNGDNRTMIIANEAGRTEYPNFSIDGKSIVYVQDKSGYNNLNGRMLDASIFVYDITGMTTKDLSIEEKTGGTNDMQPRYSADGSKIMFVNTLNTGVEEKNIWVMDLDGKNRELYFENAEMPEWR